MCVLFLSDVHRKGVPYVCVFLCEVRHCVCWFMVSLVLIGVWYEMVLLLGVPGVVAVDL